MKYYNIYIYIYIYVPTHFIKICVYDSAHLNFIGSKTFTTEPDILVP